MAADGCQLQVCNCVCEVLLDAGATLSADEDGWTPLHSAAASATAHCSTVALLVTAVVSTGDSSLLDAKTGTGQNTALHLAASNDKAPSPIRSEINALMYNIIQKFANSMTVFGAFALSLMLLFAAGSV